MADQFGGLYPFLGIVYLSQHIRHLGPRFVRSLLSSFLITLAILLPVAALTFKFQQRLILTLFRFFFASFTFLHPSTRSVSLLGHSLQTWSALILTLGEASLVVTMVMGEVFKKEKPKGLFKAVMKHQHALLGPLASVTHQEENNKSSSIHGAAAVEHPRPDAIVDSCDTIQVAPTAVMISPKESKRRKRDVVKSASVHVGQRILLWFLTLPLNLFPVAGQLAFCYINGRARAPDVHQRYFDMKDMTVSERDVWVQKREGQYRAFAVVAQALEMIPVLGLLFGFTNTIGAALWAVELERSQDALRNRKMLDDAFAE
ncbi:hypothetical protein BGZ70_002776 [Mortierella alpina]|uniref:Uncharacterized protein n=1 Tax=Mortierella alpina TaxID=64518 RepID=A0A9P6M6K0_MORAP|nr:hypothetical protein BGZ70_002776 [Mortierella alpina]